MQILEGREVLPGNHRSATLLSELAGQQSRHSRFQPKRQFFTAVLAKIATTAPTHKNFKRDLGKSNEIRFRYVFAQPNDANRELTLTVLAFDIPTAIPGAGEKE